MDVITELQSTLRYHFPLTERVRMLLRLEEVLGRVHRLADSRRVEDHRGALVALCEIIDLGSRIDLKSDLRIDLERQRGVSRSWQGNAAVDQASLENCLAELDEVIGRIERSPGRAGNRCRDHEWLSLFRARLAVPGGATQYDLPSFNFWCHRDPDLRRADILEWLNDFDEVEAAASLALRLLRTSAEPQRVSAVDGFFEQPIQGRPPQLAIIDVPVDCPCIPEISANRFVFTVRFQHFDLTSRPRPCEEAVDFQLALCGL